MVSLEETVMNAYQKMDDRCEVLSAHSRNLTRLYLEGRLDPCYHRENLLTQMQKILLRKNKANILLTGSAGCGKTALAEGLAAIIAQRRIAYESACRQAKKEHQAAMRKWKKAGEQDAQLPEPVYTPPSKPHLCDCVVYDLSLNSLVGGTKYRGEFEDRVMKMLAECKRNPNIILFIDEIHQINRIGASEGCESAGQILKPALARKDICVIGATTTEEKKLIASDKALMRRFCEIEVKPLSGNAAQETAQSILQHYCLYHDIRTSVSAGELMAQLACFLPHTVFPDNFINVVDETLAGAVFDGLDTVTMMHFNATLSRMIGKVILTADGAQTTQTDNSCSAA